MLLPPQPDSGKGQLAELADGVRLARGNHVVVGGVLLEHQPHRFHVVAGKAPVTLGVEVPQVQLVLPASRDPGRRAGDLPGHELLAAPRALMVEENAAGSVKAVALSVVDRLPVSKSLRTPVGAAGVKRSRLILRRRARHPAEHLRGRRLIEAGVRGVPTDRVQQPQRPQSGHVGRVFLLLKRVANVALGGKVVDLARLNIVDDPRNAPAVGHVAAVKSDGWQMGNPAAGVARGTPHDPVDVVALGEEQVGQIAAVLAGDAGNECAWHGQPFFAAIRAASRFVRYWRTSVLAVGE